MNDYTARLDAIDEREAWWEASGRREMGDTAEKPEEGGEIPF